MLAINYAFFALLILNLGGTSPNLKSFKDYNPASNTKLFKQDSDSDSCIYIILKLLSKSDFRKNDLLDDSEFSFDKLTYTVENIIDDSIIVIHAYLSPALNDSEPHDRTVEWLQLDLKKKLLEDASIDPANPIILNFDKEFLKEINIDCLTESNKKYFQEMNK